MIDFDLKKKWIKDHVNPPDLEKYNLSERDLTGDWSYIDDFTCCKIVERIIGTYMRRLLLTCNIVDFDEEHSGIILVKVEEVMPQ